MRGIALTRASDTGMPRPVGPAARRWRGGAAVRRRPAPSAGFPGKARRHGAAKAWPRPIRPPCPGPRPRRHSRPARSSPGIEPPEGATRPWLPKPSSQRRRPLPRTLEAEGGKARAEAPEELTPSGARSPARRRPGRALAASLANAPALSAARPGAQRRSHGVCFQEKRRSRALPGGGRAGATGRRTCAAALHGRALERKKPRRGCVGAF